MLLSKQNFGVPHGSILVPSCSVYSCSHGEIYINTSGNAGDSQIYVPLKSNNLSFFWLPKVNPNLTFLLKKQLFSHVLISLGASKKSSLVSFNLISLFRVKPKTILHLQFLQNTATQLLRNTRCQDYIISVSASFHWLPVSFRIFRI